MYISVIIPTYNRKHLLGRALESVFAQTYKDFEIIVVDDASTDATAELEIFKSCGDRITYIALADHSGVSAARNAGVGRGKGPWIAFLDSDDCWHKKKLEQQVQWLKANPAYRIVQTKEIWIRRGKRVNPPRTHEKQADDIFKESLVRCMVTPSSVIMQKSLFYEAGGFNQSLPACEDYDLWLRITCRYPVGLIDKYLLTRYGGHDDQLSATAGPLDLFRVSSLLDILNSGLLTAGQADLARRELARKARIVANGYVKRGNRDAAETYESIAGRTG